MNNFEKDAAGAKAPSNVVTVDFRKETSPGIVELVSQLEESIATWEAQIKKREELQVAVKNIEAELVNVMRGIASQSRMDDFREIAQLRDASTTSGEYTLEIDRLRQMAEGVQYFTALLQNYQDRRNAFRTQLEEIETNLRMLDEKMDDLLKQIDINREKHDGEVVSLKEKVSSVA